MEIGLGYCFVCFVFANLFITIPGVVCADDHFGSDGIGYFCGVGG